MHEHDINGYDGPRYDCSTNGSDIGEDTTQQQERLLVQNDHDTLYSNDGDDDDDDDSIGTSDEEVDDSCNQDIDLNNGDDEFNYQSIANGKFQDTIVVILAQQ